MIIALIKLPASHAPPPGETFASMMEIFRSGLFFAMTYAAERPEEPAPTMTTSETACLSRSLK